MSRWTWKTDAVTKDPARPPPGQNRRGRQTSRRRLIGDQAHHRRVRGGAPYAAGQEPPSRCRPSAAPKKWVGIGLVGALLIVVAGLGGTGVVLAARGWDCIAKAFGSLTGETATVQLSSSRCCCRSWQKEIPSSRSTQWFR